MDDEKRIVALASLSVILCVAVLLARADQQIIME